MLYKASLLAVALALLASATPAVHESGIRIPIQKRNLTLQDGTVDNDALIRETVRVKNKHRRNLITIERTMGLANYAVGAYIPPIATLPASLAARLSARQAKPEPLTDQEGDEWTGPVMIGTPAQSFTIDFDTGSADLWVPSSSCSGCKAAHSYKPSSSSTSKEQTGAFWIEYGDGSAAWGHNYTDTVSVAGISVTGQTLSAVTTESGNLVGGAADGLMGMAFQALSNLRAVPYFWTAIAQNALLEHEFSFYLATYGSELYFGGADTSKYSGNIEYNALVSTSGFWQIGNASIIINGRTVAWGIDTIIDSGTTLMYGPTSAVQTMYAKTSGAKSLSDSTYSFSCSDFPKVEVSWGNSMFDISEAFNIGQIGSGQCQTALAGEDLGLGDNVWLFGDTVMQSLYSVFSVKENAVGFAQLKQSIA